MKLLWLLLTLAVVCADVANDKIRIKGRVRKRNSRNQAQRSHRSLLPYCQFNTSIIEDNQLLMKTIEQSKFIFTGKVLSLKRSSSNNKHIFRVFIRRVLKGDLNELNVVHFESNRKKNFNGATVYVTRNKPDGERCEPFPRAKYSAIFLAEKQQNFDEDSESSEELRLVIDPVPLSLYHLDRVNAAVKDMTYRPRQPIPEEPCEKTFCRWGATCVPLGDGRAHCQCPERCPSTNDPVCSTDGRTYTNHCQLRKDSCEKRLNTRVRHTGECESEPCRGVQCAWGGLCSEEGGRPVCRCPRCPLRPSAPIRPVCGSDGRDYPSACELTKIACEQRLNATLVYNGKCDPCADYKCTEKQICQLDANRNPVCKCGEICPFTMDPVCASDGNTYANECELREEACKSRRQMRIIYKGKCSSGMNPCSSVSCRSGEQCWIGERGVAQCGCGVECEPFLRPVCGSDDKTHASACHLRRAFCKEGRTPKIAHHGPCGNLNPCTKHDCGPHGECIAEEGVPRCSCPKCGPHLRPVCASDARTYNNECKMRERSCELHPEQTALTSLYNSSCETCEEKQCDFYGVCEMDSAVRAKCVCPGNCTESEMSEKSEGPTIVCGSDGLTYSSECHLRGESCQQQKNISVAFKGDCSLCENVECKFGARCSAGECICPTDCSESGAEAVCSNTMVTYPSECELQKAACDLPKGHKQLHVIFYGDCKDRFAVAGPPIALSMESRPCGGGHLMLDGSGQELDCGGGPGRRDCPTGSYCHQTATAARCCIKNETLQRKACEEVAAGRTGGAANVGCVTGCGCHRLGAIADACETISRQCPCRPGVGGLRCDRCEPGYWGLPRIGNGHKGCIPCGCSMFGSVREDCEQMTGRCVCKPGIQGQKCTLCTNHQEILGPNGCYNAETGALAPKTCSDVVCYFGAVCVESEGRAACQCPAASCPTDSTDPSMLVCGSDGQTYPSECHLKLQACRTQEDVVVQAFGICKGLEDPTGTALPSKHYSPLQFTQQDDTNFPSKSTRHLLVPDPRNYYNTYGRGYEVNKDKDSTSSLDGEKGQHKVGYRPTPATVRVPPALVGDLCSNHADCLVVPNSQCEGGACICRQGFIAALDRRKCLSLNGETPTTTEEQRACNSEPCLNFGTCIDLPEATFACICEPQYTGDLCQNTLSMPDLVRYIETPSFDGRSYIRLKPLKAYHKFNIDVQLKTFSENGVILYDQQKADGTGDFVSLALVNGFAEFKYNLGDGVVTLTSLEKLSLNEYHTISAKRYHRDGILTVDDMEDVVGQSVGNLKALDLVEDTFIGSVPSNLTRIFDNIGTKHGFVGCIRHLRIIRHQVTKKLGREDSTMLGMENIRECTTNPCVSMPCFNGATCTVSNDDETQYSCICSENYRGIQCEEKIDPCDSNPCGYEEGVICDSSVSEGYLCKCLFGGKLMTNGVNTCSYEHSNTQETFIPEFNGSSYLQLPKLDGLSNAFRIEIWFLTKKLSGMLFYNSQSSKGRGDFISINLVDGFLQFRFNLGSGIANISSPDKVSKDKWHRVKAYRTARDGVLLLDDLPGIRGSSAPPLTELNLGQPLFLGSLPSHMKPHRLSGVTTSFIGAIQQVFINSIPLILYNEDTVQCSMLPNEDILPCATTGIVKYTGFPCLHTANPCQNQGTCIPMMNEYKCVCKNEFEGRNCEVKPFIEVIDNHTPIKFDGETFYAYRSRGGRRKHQDRGIRFELKFRTTESSGLLLWRKKGGVGHGNFLALGIIDGFAELIFSDYTSFDNESNRSERWYNSVKSELRIDDGAWHIITIRRRKKMAFMQIDLQPPNKGFAHLPLLNSKANPKLWIGGAPSLPVGLPTQLYTGLKGCIASIKANSRRLDLHKPIGQHHDIERC